MRCEDYDIIIQERYFPVHSGAFSTRQISHKYVSYQIGTLVDITTRLVESSYRRKEKWLDAALPKEYTYLSIYQ